MSDEQAPRWTPDSVSFRDVSHELSAMERVERTHSAFVDDIRALGFVELGVLFAKPEAYEEEEDDEDWVQDEPPSADELEALRVAAESGDLRDEVRFAEASERAYLDAWSRDGGYQWCFTHPDTLDVLTVEANAFGTWLSVTRLFSDGTIVRTKRRPEDLQQGNPNLSGTFVNARVPGLFRLMHAIGTDAFHINLGSKPGVGQHDYAVDAVPVADLWRAHRSYIDALALDAPAVPLTRSLVLSVNRRTMDVLLATLHHTERRATVYWRAFEWTGWAITALFLSTTMSVWPAALFAVLLLPRLSEQLWIWAAGTESPTLLLLPLAFVLAAAAWLSIPGSTLAIAIAIQTACTIASRIAYLVTYDRSRARIGSHLAEPPPVAASELEAYYPR